MTALAVCYQMSLSHLASETTLFSGRGCGKCVTGAADPTISVLSFELRCSSAEESKDTENWNTLLLKIDPWLMFGGALISSAGIQSVEHFAAEPSANQYVSDNINWL